MRAWNGVRRILALLVTVIFVLGLTAAPAMAKSRSFGGSRSFKSGTRSFTTPKSSPVPKVSSPSRSFSTPKASTPTPKSTTPTPSPTYSTTPPPATSSGSKTLTSPDSKSFSSGSRSFSTPGGLSTQKPQVGGSTGNSIPPITYDTSKTKYPTLPPVVVTGPTTFDPWYYHDWYWGRPWYWRMWHRPYYTASGGWAISWLSVVVALFAVWVVLGLLSSMMAKRRRNR